MKFQGHGTIWNPKTNKPLYRFGKECIKDITDDKIIDALMSLGYKPINDTNAIDVESTVVVEDELDYKNIVEEVEEDIVVHGIEDFSGLGTKALILLIDERIETPPKGYKRLNKEKLINLLRGD